MSRRTPDLQGQKFGKLLVIERTSSPTKDQHVYWRCICECGRETRSSGVSLRSGTKSCKTCGTAPRKAVWQQILRLYKSNAKNKNHAFELTTEKFVSLISSNCDYCGRKPHQKLWQGKSSALHLAFRWNGIDRVDSAKGYVEGNVVPCCKPCNEMKSDRSREEFLELIKAVYHHSTVREALRKHYTDLPESHCCFSPWYPVDSEEEDV